jgi:protein-S-isoprenylcysteine O-methyltransferase Ste14
MLALNQKALLGLFALSLCIAGLLFAPAWTIHYWQAWVFLAVFFISVLAITIYLMKRDPSLLERRIYAGPTAEKQLGQKKAQSVLQLAFLVIPALSAIDHRIGWSKVPVGVVALGDFLVVLGLFIVFLVFRENTFTSAIIDIYAGQKVISTGPYAIVRHPMYAGVLLMLIGEPLALGSSWALLAVIPLMLGIVWRLIQEEQFLLTNLPGYVDYRGRVRYRLVPLVW